MTVSVGIGIGARSIRAVAVEGGTVVWTAEADIDEPGNPGRVLRELLAGAPLPRWRRPSLVVALGPSLAQVRRITGLPAIGDPRILGRVLRESAGKFFLRNGKPLLTGGVRVIGPGEVWGAAYDAAVVDNLTAACVQSRLTLRCIVPAVAVLELAFDGEIIAWRDGDVDVEIERTPAGAWAEVRRSRASAKALALAAPVAPLRDLGESAAAFADAFGAAMLHHREPLALDSSAGRLQTPRLRAVLAGAAACISVSTCALLPIRSAHRAESSALARQARVEASRRAALRTSEEYRRVTGALAEVTAFATDRYSHTRLLADLNRALPTGSTLVSISVDSGGASMLALTPGAAGMLAPLERVPGVHGAEIVGTVTREVAAGTPLERVRVRFAVAPAERVERDRAAEREP
jgi:hypothetical protein